MSIEVFEVYGVGFVLSFCWLGNKRYVVYVFRVIWERSVVGV